MQKFQQHFLAVDKACTALSDLLQALKIEPLVGLSTLQRGPLFLRSQCPNKGPPQRSFLKMTERNLLKMIEKNVLKLMERKLLKMTERNFLKMTEKNFLKRASFRR